MTHPEKICASMGAAIKQIEHTRNLMAAPSFEIDRTNLLMLNNELKKIYYKNLNHKVLKNQNIDDLPLGSLSDPSNYT